MAIKSTLLSLFGWSSSSAPVDKPSKDASTSFSQSPSPYEQYTNAVKRPYSRRRKYDIYDEMDEMPDVSSVLDAYAEDATQFDREHKSTIWIEAEDSKTQTVLDALKQRLKWEEYVESVARDVAKFGDDFAPLEIQGDEIKSWDWSDPRAIERIENKQGILIAYEDTEKLQELQNAADRGEKVSYTYKPWEVVHFRLYRRKREHRQKFRNIYGTSILAGSDRIGKQVKIMDDMLVVRRLTKSLDTRIYKVDTAKSTVEEEVQILKRWKNALKRKPYIDPSNQRYDAPFDPFTWQEDVFWPQRSDSQSSVDVISGQGDVADIVDIEHFRDKFFGSMRAPKAYFGYEGDIDAKASLSAQDMRWGRSVNAVQRAVINGFTRLCQIELALKGMDYNSFKVRMVVPSVLEDLSRLEAMQTVIDIAERMASLGDTLSLNQDEWRLHIMKSVLAMTDDDIKKFSGGDDSPSDTPDEPGKSDEPDEPESQAAKKAISEVIKELAKRHRILVGSSEANEHVHPAELPSYEEDDINQDPHINPPDADEK